MSYRILDMIFQTEVNMKCKITCRHGVQYDVVLKGTRGAIARTTQMLSNCCCYVCHNHDCQSPMKGKQECKNECELYGQKFCNNQ